MKYFAFIFFISFIGIAFSQKTSFVTYSTNEGLPQSQVTSIVQDQNNYLWVGTLGGLARYNGKDFVTFSSVDGLLNNRVTFLSYLNGAIWVGHEGGISKIYKGKIQKWRLAKNENDIVVSNILLFRNKIIISTKGAGLFQLSDKNLVKINIDKNDSQYIENIFIDKDFLYVTNKSFIYRTKNISSFKKIIDIKEGAISDFKISNNKALITSSSSGYFEFDLIKWKLKYIYIPFHSNEFSKIFIDSKGNKWIISTIGLIKKTEDNKLELLDEKSGLPTWDISYVYEDKNGGIWLGSYGKGLISYPSHNIKFYNQSNGFLSDLVTNIKQDKNENIWLSSYDKGIFILNKKGEIIPVKSKSSCIWTSALNVDNAHWFGTETGLMKIMNDKSEIFGSKVNTLYRINNHQMYIGAYDGVSFYNKGKINKLSNLSNIDIGPVRALTLMDGKLYCGTDKGLFLYEKGKFIFNSKIQTTVYCLEKDGGVLWVGTEEGLFKMENNKIKRVFISSVPSSNFIIFLNIKNGKLIIGTNNGLFIVDTSNNDVKHISKKEGLVDVECIINSSFIDKQNRLWFGTVSGTAVYDLENSISNKIKPTLNISSILINHQAVAYTKYSKDLNINGLPVDLNLPFNKNNLSFQLDGITMNNHEELQYQYWIEGLDEKWSLPTKNSMLTFSSLPAGDYVLHFKAVIGKKLYSNEIVLPLVINSPFYKTWWFSVFILIVILAIIALLVKLKIKRERQKNYNETLEYKSRLMALEQKSLNASMNRHFIFNSLNSIQYFINSQDRLSANRYLTNFAKLIRKNLDSTVEEGSMITLNQELEGLELYLSLEAMRFKDRFDYEIHVDDEIDTESIKVPSMLLQPFIENSIIHGILPNETQKGKITIGVSADENILTIQIDDNGIGIENSLTQKSTENGDHKSQGMEITSKRIDLIKKLSHQSFELIGPFQIKENNRLINGTRVLLKIPFKNLDN
ncbi:MAG: histidine kinase [Flavobacteriia bacterium]|nr:histidine kinase [Flavobacteriia bacterium]